MESIPDPLNSTSSLLYGIPCSFGVHICRDPIVFTSHSSQIYFAKNYLDLHDDISLKINFYSFYMISGDVSVH